MLKATIISLLFIFFSMPATSQDIRTCGAQGAGNTFIANNGQEYCISRRQMNWWTALGWCQKIGMTMVSYPADCNCEGQNCPSHDTTCPNFYNTGTTHIHTSTPLDAGTIASIDLTNGTVPSYGLRWKHLPRYALCK